MLYYLRSLEKINIKEQILRVYTDDYEWAKQQLPLIFKDCTLDFFPEKFDDINSLWTMSKHKYLIGANSTFSLWAYYFGMEHMCKFFFPLEWAEDIRSNGFELFSKNFNNVELVSENS